VSVVTGASRGAGAAIAEELGRAGATVYVTGRSTRSTSRTEGLPGTIDETAERVTAAGGRGIAVRCDHTDDADVAALFDRIRAESRRLDLLVNNAWGGYEQHDMAEFTADFWTQPLVYWDRMFTAGVRAHLVASRSAAPLMVERRSGLIVHTIAWAFGAFLGNLYYDTAKAAIVRLAFGEAKQLAKHRVAAVALAPGFMRTERVMAAHARAPFDLAETESPVYVARAVRALAEDARAIERTGAVLTAGELAREYGFTDVDGRQPPPFYLPATEDG
jgi:NAD(P)-dependent dehydrogenase (short-subunit alcohol dehydrogenase family)